MHYFLIVKVMKNFINKFYNANLALNCISFHLHIYQFIHLLMLQIHQIDSNPRPDFHNSDRNEVCSSCHKQN